MSAIINLFGTSLRVWRIDFDELEFEKYQQICQKYAMSIQELFTNMDFISSLGFQSWDEMTNQKAKFYFKIHDRNSIEIKFKGKKSLKINSTNLLEENLLFKLYQTNLLTENYQIILGKRSILIIQEEIGLCAKYETKENVDSIENICFQLIRNEQLSNELFLNSISHEKGKLFLFKKDDTLVRNTLVKEL